MKNKKGAVELSMSTIVVVVMAIVLLSLGIMFIKNIMGKVGITSDDAFEAANKEIQNLMGGDEAFYLSGPGHDIKVGSEKNINAGIQNFLGEDMDFRIEVEGDNIDWLQFNSEVFVKAGDREPFVIFAKVPKTAKPGISSFYTMKVYDENGEVYESGQIAINVK